MALFTFVLDYRGGTYIHQVVSDDPSAATIAWVSTMPIGEVPSLSDGDRTSLREAMLSESPCQVEGTRHVWCLSAILRGHLALAHIIETAP